MKKNILFFLFVAFCGFSSFGQTYQYVKEEPSKNTKETPEKTAEKINQKPDNQSEETNSLWDKFYFGGNFGFRGGNVTVLDISPIVGYQLTERWSAGLGASYQYYSFNNRGTSFSSNVYGGRVFSRYLIDIQEISATVFPYVEYEKLYYKWVDGLGNALPMRGYDAFFAGGGIRYPLGERLAFNVMALYNLSWSEGSSLYVTPYVIRGGITF